ncbi:MAG: efflux RND transporter permease subunit [Ignavibacteriales bacterium]|nr:MAG: efflux RND transporter permease subunit [Ignavibacteriales bacterium]
MTITELSIKRPSLIIVIFLSLTLLGIFSYTQLKYELIPKVSPPVITVTTVYPGASPNEVENGVSKIIEDALSGMDKVSEIRSTSQEGLSFVVLELLNSADVDISLQDAIRKVGEVSFLLPEGAKSPTVSKIALDEIPVLRIGVTGNLPPKEFYTFIEDQIKPQLSKIPGVGQISIIGGEKREIKINLNQDKLRSLNIPSTLVAQIVRGGNLDFPTGTIKDDDLQFVVRIAGKFEAIEQIRRLPVASSRNGGTIYLEDIAEIEDGIEDLRNITRLNGKTMIGINVSKQTDANSVEVANLVKNQLLELETLYKNNNIKFKIAQDGSLFTIRAADAVKFDLGVAVVLVALVMLLFLHSIRNSLIILVAIPASLISTFIAMYAFDFSLNLMTLLGLSLVVGILVDDSIVVLENIYHHLENGEHKRTAALRGRNEIGFAALAITMVDIAVFLPLGLVSGIIGNIMRQFSLVVVFSTLMSLFVSFTITPMLASRFGKLERLTKDSLAGRIALWFENAFHSFTEKYINFLKWSLINKKKVILYTVIFFFASLSLIPLGFIGSEFLAVADRGQFAITVELPPGSKLHETNRVSDRIERMISGIPEVQSTYVTVGASNEGLIGFSNNNVSEINVTLTDKWSRNKSTQEVMNYIKSEIVKVPGIKVRINPIGLFGIADWTPIQMAISGTNVDSVQLAAEMIEDAVSAVPGTADVRLGSESGNPETRIVIDREKLNQFGLSIAEVGAAVRIALTGDDQSKFRDGNTEYTIRIRLDSYDRNSIEDLSVIHFINRKGQKIELGQFATIVRSTGPTKLQRQNRNSSVLLFSQAIGRPSGTISQEIESSIAGLNLPEGISVTFLGDVKHQKESFESLGLALLAAIVFTYLIMVALYDSFFYPFVVLFSVPLAIIGALLALAITNKALSIFSILGIIMLVGLVGKNAILLVDRTNAMREKGLPLYEAILDAGKMRLRPIMMTTLTMIFGMMPIALSASEGAEWKSGLAWALIGGLTSSLILTLVIVPIVYQLMDGFIEKLKVRIKKYTD